MGQKRYIDAQHFNHRYSVEHTLTHGREHITNKSLTGIQMAGKEHLIPLASCSPPIVRPRLEESLQLFDFFLGSTAAPPCICIRAPHLLGR